MKDLVNFIFEAAVVKRVRRTGWQVLGDNEESLGEHTFMTLVIAFVLAKQLRMPLDTVLAMSLFHDFHEARIGEVDKIALRYITRDTAKANADIFRSTFPDIETMLVEYEGKETPIARLVYEANILALLVELRVLEERGNVNAREWFDKNADRLRLPEAVELARLLGTTSPQEWWKEMRDEIHSSFRQNQ